MSSLDQQTNAGARDPKKQVSEFDRWKETATLLAPLLLLALIFMAVWSAVTTLEFFQAHLEALQEHGNFDEVTPFYIYSFSLLVMCIPYYVCTLQHLVNPDVYHRNERKFLWISVLLGVIMFLAMFVNTVGISVDFGWPFSMKQKGGVWLINVGMVTCTAAVISNLAGRIKSRRLEGLPKVRWIVATDTRRVCCALVVALATFLTLLTWEMMLPEVTFSDSWWKPFSAGGTPLFQLSLCILLWLILFYSLSAIRLPGITIFVGLCLVLAFFDGDDNHYFRQSQSEARMAPGLAGSFQSWLKERGDTAAFADSYYPVYMVAAEGGGMYAAYHAGTILARIEDARKTFAQHVFAISSVSGGSLGAAIFSAIVKQGGEGGDAEALVDRFLSQDLLTNIVVRATTSDLAQRALPITFGSLDRARGIEFAVEKAWQRTFPSEISTDNQFAADFSSLWRPNGTAPALLLNTTEVETGDRVVISPFSLKAAADKFGVLDLRALQDDVPGIDRPSVRLSCSAPDFPI